MNKYIIFQKDLEIKNNEIVAWAPKSTNKRPNGLPWWREVENIRENDLIYYISDTYLIATARAEMDASIYQYNSLFNKEKPNPGWSDVGYGVFCSLLNDYSNMNISITKELGKFKDKLSSVNDIKPFEWNNGNIKAHQGGYCYKLSDTLENLLIEIINLYQENELGYENVTFTDKKFSYSPIKLNNNINNFGTSEIADIKINKGKYGESKVLDFFKEVGINVRDVADDKKEFADLILEIGNNNYYLEIKNISSQGQIHYIYLSDTQIKQLCIGSDRLCLYVDGIIYLSKKNCKNTFFKDIKNSTDQIRKYTIDNYNGYFFVSDLKILIDKKIIDTYFILINSINKDQLIRELVDFYI